MFSFLWVKCLWHRIQFDIGLLYYRENIISLPRWQMRRSSCIFKVDDRGHSCAILARIFWVLAWDCKISRYLGIVLRLSLNFIILGIGIEIEIEFWILQYWYWYWYLVLMFLILILRLRLKFLSPVSIIGIVSFHKLIKLCIQAVNS